MSHIHRIGEKRKSVEELEYEEGHDELHMSPHSPNRGHPMESEKRLRREIANSNERRRMQSINAGFESLKSLIPHHREEKLSKAAILQQTSEHIANLENEKNRLLSHNSIFRQKLKELNCNPDALLGSASSEHAPPTPITAPPAAKRRKRDTESSDEGISLGYDEAQMDELRKEVVDLRIQLERERKLRQATETRLSAPAVEASLVTPSPPIINRVVNPTVSPTVVKAEPVPPTSAQPYKVPTVITDPPQTKFEVVSTPVHGNTVLPPPPRHLPVFNSSMSKRNLDTIVEAIRHLEGDNIYSDLRRPLAPPKRTTEDSSSLSSSSSAISSDDAADSPPPHWPTAIPSQQEL